MCTSDELSQLQRVVNSIANSRRAVLLLKNKFTQLESIAHRVYHTYRLTNYLIPLFAFVRRSLFKAARAREYRLNDGKFIHHRRRYTI